ncbi:MAG: VWA domain-containing protein [Acidobacteria bacterium]|nr:VWA domain-containing protein [Acidobacteriota bacterium]
MRLLAGLLEPLGVRLARPELFYPVLAMLVLLAGVSAVRRRRYCAHSLAHLPLLDSLRPSPLRHLPRVFTAAGLLLAIVALLDPRLVSREKVTKLEALEVALVVDLSLSMKEPIGGLFQRPVYSFSTLPRPAAPAAPRPPRIQVMRKVLAQIIERRHNDRLALVVFSEHGYVITPPTTDHVYVNHYVELVDPDVLTGEGRTAIGEGVATAIDVLEHGNAAATADSAQGRVIIVFTDGENNTGRDPIAAVEAARQRGYRVYLIAMDLPEGVERKETQVQLIRAVEASGGRYYDARSEAELARASQTIDRLERGVFADRTIEHDIPVYHLFVLAALAVLYAGLILGSIPYFIDLT